MVHATAQIAPGVKLGADVDIGAYSVIAADVEIGDGTVLGPHVVVNGPTRIGRGNHIHAFASIGGDPQDKKFEGERSELVVGDRNRIREFVTINRGTGQGGGATRIGNDNWIMAYVHIAHDCQVGNHTVFSNNATLAGHVVIGDHVILSGFSGVHQFCRIGEHAFIGMGCLVNGDVPPFVIMANEYGRPRGINTEGLKRRGFSAERIAGIRRAYKVLYMSGLQLSEAREELARIAAESPDVAMMIEFLQQAQRPIVR
ncbi:MAG TPA: acyl-ACP--UDP-N-acetylglucosamine O-acyltransferase [Rhodanobacteraceae bacterium]|jgi:UDP-N-acetylglucosamine acyltransferase|nr:acyl-ACP--UDP-N-acetylglucosamine O-acyltransferase [Rhodanobacteraceae bacterium]